MSEERNTAPTFLGPVEKLRAQQAEEKMAWGFQMVTHKGAVWLRYESTPDAIAARNTLARSGSMKVSTRRLLDAIEQALKVATAEMPPYTPPDYPEDSVQN